MTATTLTVLAFRSVEHDSPGPEAPTWEALIAQHDRKVVLALLARGVRLDRAREVAHEAWARLFEQHTLGRLNRIELPGLAIAQATFLLAEQGRRDQRRPASLELSKEAANSPDLGVSAETLLVDRDRLAVAEAALVSCSPRSQHIFRLAYENPEMAQAEIAERVGLSLQRVRQTLCEVRAKIRAALQEASND